MKVLLIRHGRTSEKPAGGLLDRAGIEQWRAAYDAAGIARDDSPPADLIAEVERAKNVAASDLPRALDSAARLAPGRVVLSSQLLREIPLPIPAWIPFRAPFGLWDALVHVRWGLDVLRRQDTSAELMSRVDDAARWCAEICQRDDTGSGTLAVITHGVFRRHLARRLVASGWRYIEGPRSYAHWSVWRLETRKPSTHS